MEHINDRIRDRAHALWEAEGRPHGRHQEHWIQAVAEIATEGDAEREADAKARSGPPKHDVASALSPNFPVEAAPEDTSKTSRKKAPA